MDILNLLTELCAIPSVTGVPGAEDRVPRFIHDKLSGWPYFKAHPEDIWLEPLENDRLGRHNFAAIVRSQPATKRTILLISHHDVVDVDVFGRFKSLAFDPTGYTIALKAENLNPEAAADLKDGRWLFGRGVSDMKGGMAVQIALLSEYAKNPEKLGTNLLLMTLADEEDDGYGVHQAVKMLLRLHKEDGLEFAACVDSEPTITNAAKTEGRIYTGTIGNASVFALCIGKESHVGEYFQGINAALIASYIVQELEGSPALADSWMGHNYSPAACLKLRDMRKLYSVTLLDKMAAAFNVLMVQKSPSELLSITEDAADRALNSAIAQINRNRAAAGYEPVQCSPKVLTYAELLSQAAEKSGQDKRQLLEGVYKNITDTHLDTQEKGLAAVSELVDMAGLTGPAVVVGFLSPYCQPRLNLRKTEGERRVLAAVEAVCKTAESYGVRMIHDEVYEGISDLSEMGYQGTEADISTLTGNMVGFGVDFNHPFEAMRQLDIPVLNLGPIGKDAHKQTERVDTAFLTEILPELLKELLRKLGL